MSTLYGDNIFVKEVSIESILASFDESAKLFTDFDKYVVNEGVDFKAFKNKIVEAIKKCIDKIKEFLDWLKKKFKAAWNALTLRIKRINLKKSLQDAKNRRANKSSNESTILEAKYSDLSEFLNTECGGVDIGLNAKEISDIILNNKGNITIDDAENLVFYPNESSQKSKYVLRTNPETTVEEFIRKYENDLKNLDSIVDTISGLEAYLNKQIKDLKSTQTIIDSDNITSIEELKKAINANDFANKDSSVSKKIASISKQLNLCSRVLDDAKYYKNKYAQLIEYIDNNLKGTE